jgi:pilus assembly protein CpaC
MFSVCRDSACAGAVRTARQAAAILFTAIVVIAAGGGVKARADGDVISISAGQHASIKVTKGKPQTIKTKVPFSEIVIGDPDVANVNPLTDRSFYVLGTKLGTTGIALFDKDKQPVGNIDVEVTLDTKELASTIRANVPGTDIHVDSANGRLILSGTAKDTIAAEKAKSIANRFSGDEQVINSVNVSSSQQVQLNVRFVEINRQAGRELGTKFSATYSAGRGGGVTFNSSPNASGNIPAGEVIGSLLSGGFSADVAITALEDKGVARRLAEPNLIARSGETASFLAGGEFPIPVSEENGVVTVSYKKYGVSLDFTPTVLADGLISLEIAPEVSSVDASSSYKIGDISVPGFVVRRAKTSVDLKSGQSFMIAGLLQNENDTTTQALPGLGRLPILGPLFSSKAYQRHETDLVIIVTPYLVKPIDPSKKAVTPLDDSRPASNADYFLGNVDEVKGGARSGVALAGVPVVSAASGHFLDLKD